jgi:DNA-binding transcriptional MerR regulator
MRMEKSADAFRTISEVAEDLDLPQHVLRFWETRFAQIKPLKRAGGRRFYRPDDVELLRAIRQLLYGEGYTIKGVQKILKEQGVQAIIAASRANNASRLAVAPPPQALASHAQTDGNSESILEIGSAEEAEADSRRRSSQGCKLSNGASNAIEDRALPPQTTAEMENLLTELVECQRILDVARRG